MTDSATAPRIGAVVFDLGGVLVEWDPRNLYREHFAGDDEAMEQFLGTVCTPTFNDELDRGRPFAEGVAELVARHPDLRELIELWHTDWARMLGEPIAGSVQIVAELRAGGVPVYALSNWSAETFPIAVERFRFLGEFDGVVISGEVGAIKPSPEIFSILCDRHGLRPETSVFIDDNEANVAGARAVGFDGIVFRSPDALRTALEERGLL